MTATAHALVGGAIAASVPNPILGIALSAATHPILDLIPHWDFGWGWKKKTRVRFFLESSFDFGLGLLLAYLIFGQSTQVWYLFLCVFASEVWDMMEAPYFFLNWKFPPFSSFYNVQHKLQGKAKLPWGILTQVATVTGVVLILGIFH